MTGIKAGTSVYLATVAAGLLIVVSGAADAQHLPIKTYTTADGLPRDLVNRIVRDSRGFLWFCTGDGLSRFDGYEFKTYSTEQGLSHPFVNDLIETKSGTYWVATNGGGTCRFNPAERAAPGAASRFRIYPVGDNPTTNRVNLLCEDSEGIIWAGTDSGMFYLDPAQDRFVPYPPICKEVYALCRDRQGNLWIGGNNGLWRRPPDGRMIHYSIQPSTEVRGLLEDQEGNLWVGYAGSGLVQLDPQQLPMNDCNLLGQKGKGLRNQYTAANGSPSNYIHSLYQSRDGHLWLQTAMGLAEFNGQRFRLYTTAQGLFRDGTAARVEDCDGNLWLSSKSGAMKLARGGFTTYDKADGLHPDIRAISENQAGELCVITKGGGTIHPFHEGKFIATDFNLPQALSSGGWGVSQSTFQDRAGDWWVPTIKGLLRFPRVERVEQLARVRPKALYRMQGEYDVFDIFRMFEDARGDIWVGLGSGERNRLLKWERATEAFHYYTEADGVPVHNPPSAFCEDAGGNLWIGYYDGGLVRYSAGRFTLFQVEDGLPPGRIHGLYLDHTQRLWIASGAGGLARIDDPSADRPAFIRFTTADGLSTNVLFCITEDEQGRIYVGTGRGVDRLDSATGNVKHYTSADGLTQGQIRLAFRDRHGALWFGGLDALSRLIPAPDSLELPPQIFISGVRLTGIAQPFSDLGETDVRGLELAPHQNHIQIDFSALAFGKGETLRYQYKFEGADGDWQALTLQRSVNYANLAAGTYRFLVRAVNAEGVFSESAASLEFTILAPIWRRWWFLLLAALAVSVAVYGDFRNLVRRRLALERVRVRIAADLHDDIGSSLSQIAVLSEVLRKQLGTQEARISKNLSLINRVSQEALDSMSDIVWAINPQQDHLSDLVRRMRRVASEVLPARNIEFKFNAPTTRYDLKLGADIRRQVFLMFKEAINNLIRHSECTRAEIKLEIEGTWLVLAVADNGKGFAPDQVDEGNGLVSLRRRTRALDGKIEIVSVLGEGTTITIKVPHSRHRRFSSGNGKPSGNGAMPEQ